MGHAPELTGPDMSAGIEMSRIPENIPLLGHANGAAVILVRKGSTFHALGATCSHYSGPLAEGLVVGETVRCPWHHACFDLRTGEALGAPALDPIPCYEVIRRDDRVSVAAAIRRESCREDCHSGRWRRRSGRSRKAATPWLRRCDHAHRE
jgi:nitrite reductase/ring-hydroxylating ferredoxin subunit